MLIADSKATFYAHLCRGQVSIVEDFDTRRVDVRAYIGTAPNDHTVIVYPYRAYDSGYLNKTHARKLARTMKRAMQDWCKAHNVTLTESIEITERFWR